MQLWNCETLEIFWQIIFHLSNSMEFICATVKLWDFWNFWTNYLSFILYYGIHLCYCETVRLLKLIQKYFFCLFIRMQFIFATVKLLDSWNFLTNNFCIYQIVCNSLCNSEPVRLKIFYKQIFEISNHSIVSCPQGSLTTISLAPFGLLADNFTEY